MATGDQQDIVSRIKATLPPWFGDNTPVLDGILSGMAKGLSLIYSLILYVALQTRIKTATDGFLDLVAADYFGTSLMRAQGQSDASFRARILINLIRERGTRAAVAAVLIDLTGRTPHIFEPMRPLDTGAYNQGAVLAYGVAGGYASSRYPNQFFVTAFRPQNTGIPNIAGYTDSPGAYATAGQAEYANPSMVGGSIQDADILAAVDAVRPVGYIAWVGVQN